MCVVARMSTSFIEENIVEVGKSSSTCSRMGREAVRCCCLDFGRRGGRRDGKGCGPSDYCRIEQRGGVRPTFELWS
jgi:hypothetical protein